MLAVVLILAAVESKCDVIPTLASEIGANIKSSLNSQWEFARLHFISAAMKWKKPVPVDKLHKLVLMQYCLQRGVVVFN